MMGSVAGGAGASSAGAAGAGGAPRTVRAGAATRGGGARRTIGLGAVTVTCGSETSDDCANACGAIQSSDTNAELPRRSTRPIRTVIIVPPLGCFGGHHRPKNITLAPRYNLVVLLQH